MDDYPEGQKEWLDEQRTLVREWFDAFVRTPRVTVAVDGFEPVKLLVIECCHKSGMNRPDNFPVPPNEPTIWPTAFDPGELHGVRFRFDEPIRKLKHAVV